jgi:hypothetical protein
MAADEEDVVEVAGDGLQIVMAGDEEAAFGGEFFEKTAQILLRGLVEAGERLVEQQNVRFLSQSTGDEGALLLAAGEGADLAVLEIAQLHAGERALDDLGVVTRILPPPAEIRVAAHLDEAAHGDGEVPVDVATLRQVGDSWLLRVSGLPRQRILPLSAEMSPARDLSSVLLPAPFGPMSAMLRPHSVAKLIFSSARTS